MTDFENRLEPPRSFTLMQVVYALAGVGALAFVGWIAFDNGAQKIWSFAVEMCVFTVQLLMVLAVAKFAEWLCKWLSAQTWFDLHGAGQEMEKVQNRVDTDREQPGDSVACAVKLAAWVLFSAVIVFAFFFLHAPAAPTG